jgi:hypothetical protein
MAGVVWVVRKIRHLIESSRKQPTIIFTDHAALAGIIKQTSLISFNTDKLNLRLVRASQYLSALPIDIKVKSEKFHIISNALSRLFSIADNDKPRNLEEGGALEDLEYDLNAMIVQSISELKTSSFDTKAKQIHDYLDVFFDQGEILIEMTEFFRKFLLKAYAKDVQWTKIKQKLKTRKNSENITDGMIFHSAK